MPRSRGGFKHLAEEGRFDTRRKAVRGLVIWGGKFSVPILVKLMDDRDTFLVREVIKALGDLKDERGRGRWLRLADFHHRDEAQSALRNMGSAAEDALIAAAPTEDAQVCLAAINLLGEIGTPKSFKVLRTGVASRNPRSSAKQRKTRSRGSICGTKRLRKRRKRKNRGRSGYGRVITKTREHESGHGS